MFSEKGPIYSIFRLTPTSRVNDQVSFLLVVATPSLPRTCFLSLPLIRSLSFPPSHSLPLPFASSLFFAFPFRMRASDLCSPRSLTRSLCLPFLFLSFSCPVNILACLVWSHLLETRLIHHRHVCFYLLLFLSVNMYVYPE